MDQPVDVRAEGGRIIVETLPVPAFRLDDLVAGITEENRHEAVDFGPAAGEEAC